MDLGQLCRLGLDQQVEVEVEVLDQYSTGWGSCLTEVSTTSTLGSLLGQPATRHRGTLTSTSAHCSPSPSSPCSTSDRSTTVSCFPRCREQNTFFWMDKSFHLWTSRLLKTWPGKWIWSLLKRNLLYSQSQVSAGAESVPVPGASSFFCRCNSNPHGCLSWSKHRKPRTQESLCSSPQHDHVSLYSCLPQSTSKHQTCARATMEWIDKWTKCSICVSCVCKIKEMCWLW